jgi:hypothetical protein
MHYRWWNSQPSNSLKNWFKKVCAKEVLKLLCRSKRWGEEKITWTFHWDCRKNPAVQKKLVAGEETEVFQYDPKTKCIKTLTIEECILQKCRKCRCQDWWSKPFAFWYQNKYPLRNCTFKTTVIETFCLQVLECLGQCVPSRKVKYLSWQVNFA